MAYINPLNTEQEVIEYKKWLSSQHYLFLGREKRTLEIYKKHEINNYPNLNLRIELISQEMQKR